MFFFFKHSGGRLWGCRRRWGRIILSFDSWRAAFDCVLWVWLLHCALRRLKCAWTEVTCTLWCKSQLCTAVFILEGHMLIKVCHVVDHKFLRLCCRRCSCAVWWSGRNFFFFLKPWNIFLFLSLLRKTSKGSHEFLSYCPTSWLKIKFRWMVLWPLVRGLFSRPIIFWSGFMWATRF